MLTTKLYVPRPRPNLVPRPRLAARLDEGLCLGHRLAVIPAPADVGKTTLLSDEEAQAQRALLSEVVARIDMGRKGARLSYTFSLEGATDYTRFSKADPPWCVDVPG